MSADSLYCPKCATPVAYGVPACPSCGVPFVQQVAAPTEGHPAYQQSPYQPQPVYQQQPVSHLSEANSKKMAAGLCAILLSGLGVHKFILGYQGAGWVYLGLLIGGVMTSCFFPFIVLSAPIMGIISLIEGVIYLTKTDEEFYQIYMLNRREWF